jgi:hypothetical protein
MVESVTMPKNPRKGKIAAASIGAAENVDVPANSEAARASRQASRSDEESHFLQRASTVHTEGQAQQLHGLLNDKASNQSSTQANGRTVLPADRTASVLPDAVHLTLHEPSPDADVFSSPFSHFYRHLDGLWESTLIRGMSKHDPDNTLYRTLFQLRAQAQNIREDYGLRGPANVWNVPLLGPETEAAEHVKNWKRFRTKHNKLADCRVDAFTHRVNLKNRRPSCRQEIGTFASLIGHESRRLGIATKPEILAAQQRVDAVLTTLDAEEKENEEFDEQLRQGEQEIRELAPKLLTDDNEDMVRNLHNRGVTFVDKSLIEDEVLSENLSVVDDDPDPAIHHRTAEWVDRAVLSDDGRPEASPTAFSEAPLSDAQEARATDTHSDSLTEILNRPVP